GNDVSVIIVNDSDVDYTLEALIISYGQFNMFNQKYYISPYSKILSAHSHSKFIATLNYSDIMQTGFATFSVAELGDISGSFIMNSDSW
ncbi:MAG: hypothetical protein Q8J76_07695, partial [Desulfobulbaceae bacterium]|nr:hypothetical protein [Desulfobulbaceae bacterium]